MPIDIDHLRVHKNGNPSLVIESEQKRGKEKAEKTINKIISIDNLWRSNRHEIDTLRKQRTLLTKAIRDKIKANLSANEEKEQSKTLGKTISEKEMKMNEYETIRNKMLNKVGNILDKRVPLNNDVEIKRWGDHIINNPNTYYANNNNNENKTTISVDADDDDDNANIKSNKKKKKKKTVSATTTISTIHDLIQNKKIKSHIELCNVINGIENERGTSVAGKRGYFLRGPLVLLKMALERYAMDFLCNNSNKTKNEKEQQQPIFEPIYTPFFIEPVMMHATSQIEEFNEMIYETTKNDNNNNKYMIATSEQPLSCMHQSEWFLEKELPKRYAGTSTCFRKEAGNTTQDLGGLFRVHQFEKIEQFSLCMEKDSDTIHHEFLNNAELFLQSLNIPYRVVVVNGTNLSHACSLKYDIEAWFPHSKEYREVVSCSNCTDYQARALDIRCGAKKMLDGGKKFYTHMINGTLCACQRLICAILENFQRNDCISIPNVLQPYMYGKTNIPFIINVTKMEEFDLGKKNAAKAMRTAARKKDRFIAQQREEEEKEETYAGNAKKSTYQHGKGGFNSSSSSSSSSSNNNNNSNSTFVVTTNREKIDDDNILHLFSKKGMSWLNKRLDKQSYIMGKNGYVASAEDAIVFNALKLYPSILFKNDTNDDDDDSDDAGYNNIKRWYRNIESALNEEREHWPATKEHVLSGRHSYYFNLQLPTYLKELKKYEMSTMINQS